MVSCSCCCFPGSSLRPLKSVLSVLGALIMGGRNCTPPLAPAVCSSLCEACRPCLCFQAGSVKCQAEHAGIRSGSSGTSAGIHPTAPALP